MVKGSGFERVLIIRYEGITKWLRTGDSEHVAGSADEVHVGVTRTYQSVAFIHDGDAAVPGIFVFQP
jgi:DNA helicase II / ATP-dependent DNA helicase PcrA